MACYWSGTVEDFLNTNNDQILGALCRAEQGQPSELQRNAWTVEIQILKDQFISYRDDRIMFEYVIPRIGKRVDVVLLHHNIVFLLEFKCGDNEYKYATYNQVYDYALDLKSFQKESDDKIIIPIMVPTDAPEDLKQLNVYDGVAVPLRCNAHNIQRVIDYTTSRIPTQESFDYVEWENSQYLPTPTIIEAAIGLYNHMRVEDIARNDAGAQNLHKTSQTIDQIVQYSKYNGKKSICFITGVPGAGKTLVGLNTAISYSNADNRETAVFLSGNKPLVDVLTEALARDKCEQARESGQNIPKTEALRDTSTFIQIVHRYRSDYVGNNNVPPEHIAIFDEAQRAWTQENLANWMSRKKGIPDFEQSEPEFLISTIDRRDDWAVIICLIGGGQEINTGEAGLSAWFDALRNRFPNWDVYISPNLKDSEYLRIPNFDTTPMAMREQLLNESWDAMVSGVTIHEEPYLHLSSSMRSYRTSAVSSFVKALLDLDVETAKDLYQSIRGKYPIFLTRNLDEAKAWVKKKCRGSRRRYGLVASSSGLRLKPDGIFVKNPVDVKHWFLDDKSDVRSSYYLEDAVTEFDIQGLELDYALVAWDADFRIKNNYWQYKNFTRSTWARVSQIDRQLYLKNAYRVLLTRAREGMAIYVPQGNDQDPSRKKEFYDGTYNYLKSIMPQAIENK